MIRFVSFAALAACAAAPSLAQSVAIAPSLDNTIYQASSSLSNGLGDHLFSGINARNQRHRALIAFDVAAAIPAGVTITSVKLNMHISRQASPNRVVSLRRVLQRWGEGTSNASGEEGGGAPATTNDATWTFALFATRQWSTPGGDFAADVSSSALCEFFGPVTFGSTPRLVADVQSWLDSPSSNYGWLLLGDESTTATSQRFDSRHHPDPERRPYLVVHYQLCPADFNGDGQVDFFDYLDFVAAFAAEDPSADFNGDGQIDFFDYLDFVQAYNDGCDD